MDALNIPIQRRLLFWLGSQKSKRRCIGVFGASILYQARKVSAVVLV
jgi:hypothetical protein